MREEILIFSLFVSAAPRLGANIQWIKIVIPNTFTYFLFFFPFFFCCSVAYLIPGQGINTRHIRDLL